MSSSESISSLVHLWLVAGAVVITGEFSSTSIESDLGASGTNIGVSEPIRFVGWFCTSGAGATVLDLVLSSCFLGLPTGLFAIGALVDSSCFFGHPTGCLSGSPPGVAFLSFKLIVPPGMSS